MERTADQGSGAAAAGEETGACSSRKAAKARDMVTSKRSAEQARIIFRAYSRHHAPMALTLTEALRLAAASQLLVVVGLLLRDHRRSRITVASSLLAACVVCYLALPLLLRPGAPLVLRPIAGAGAFAVPFAFWLAARLYFEDDFLPRPVHGLLLLGWLAARAAVVPCPLPVPPTAAPPVAAPLRPIHSVTPPHLLLP